MSGWALGIAGAAFCLAGVIPPVARTSAGVAGTLTGAVVLALVTLRRERSGRPFRAGGRTSPPAPVRIPAQAPEAVPDAATGRAALARHAAAQAALLRSFDGFEAVLNEILVENVDDDTSRYTLHDCVRQLRTAGLLGADEIATWAAALRTRQLVLSAGGPTPDLPVIEHALAQMIRLQVVLTDRRHQVRDEARLIPIHR